jgi:hypothetical protein
VGKSGPEWERLVIRIEQVVWPTGTRARRLVLGLIEFSWLLFYTTWMFQLFATVISADCWKQSQEFLRFYSTGRNYIPLSRSVFLSESISTQVIVDYSRLAENKRLVTPSSCQRRFTDGKESMEDSTLNLTLVVWVTSSHIFTKVDSS